MNIKIWEKYLIREFIKVFVLFILSFYLLYIIIDYSTKAKSFINQGFQLNDIGLYYLCHFSKRASILIPFGLLIATVKTLIQLNKNHELVALYIMGIPKKRLLYPFLLIACACSSLLYFNEESFLPKTLFTLDRLKGKNFESPLWHPQEPTLNSLRLKDGTSLLYQMYFPTKQYFFDVMWITDSQNIYRIKKLYPYKNPPEGHFVDLISKEGGSFFKLKESWESKTFSHIDIDYKLMELMAFPVMYLPISELHSHYLLQKEFRLEARAASTLTWFLTKALTPLNCLFVIMGVAPMCMNFGRKTPVFLIYCLGLFSLISFYTILDAAIVLGEHLVIPPLLAIGTPISFFGLGSIYSFWKLK
jgi:lipopolysaccharide export system permease protein